MEEKKRFSWRKIFRLLISIAMGVIFFVWTYSPSRHEEHLKLLEDKMDEIRENPKLIKNTKGDIEFLGNEKCIITLRCDIACEISQKFDMSDGILTPVSEVEYNSSRIMQYVIPIGGAILLFVLTLLMMDLFSKERIIQHW